MDYLLAESNLAESPSGTAAAAEPEFIEMSMLLPSWQIDALAKLAARQQISIGQLLRRGIARMLREN